MHHINCSLNIPGSNWFNWRSMRQMMMFMSLSTTYLTQPIIISSLCHKGLFPRQGTSPSSLLQPLFTVQCLSLPWAHLWITSCNRHSTLTLSDMFLPTKRSPTGLSQLLWWCLSMPALFIVFQRICFTPFHPYCPIHPFLLQGDVLLRNR